MNATRILEEKTEACPRQRDQTSTCAPLYSQGTKGPDSGKLVYNLTLQKKFSCFSQKDKHHLSLRSGDGVNALTEVCEKKTIERNRFLA